MSKNHNNNTKKIINSPISDDDSDHGTEVEGLTRKELQLLINRLNTAETDLEKKNVLAELAKIEYNNLYSVAEELYKRIEHLEQENKIIKKKKNIKDIYNPNSSAEIKRIRDIFYKLELEESNKRMNNVRTRFLPKNIQK